MAARTPAAVARPRLVSPSRHRHEPPAYLRALFNRLLDAEVCRVDEAQAVERHMRALEDALASEDAARREYHAALIASGFTHEDMR